MAAVKVPYPPSPTNVPEDLTDFPASYKSKQNLLLIGLFVFLLFYFGLIALTILLGTYCVFTLNDLFPLKIIGIVACGITFLFLVKGFFKRHAEEKDWNIEITEEEQPILFAFIDRLTEELNAPKPDRVFVCPDVNAAMISRTSLINLIKEPKKDLLIGLGLVNCMNLSEFKFVMSHELGHFCQSSHSDVYTMVVRKVIHDLVAGEDFLDRFVNWCKNQGGFGYLVGGSLGGLLWLGRMPLEVAFRIISIQWLAVRRESEYHADLVATSVAGSDALASGLLRSVFGFKCFEQAVSDLAVALEQKLYTRDLYLHQSRAAAIVRRISKDPNLGMPPELDHPLAGKSIRVFDREQEEIDDDQVPVMYRMHPPNYDREENAKETFIPAVVDIRSPWILFTDVAELKERLTYKFYRMAFRVKKTVELADPEEVQQYIDDEHAETTYHERYQGVYDIRPLQPGDIGELNQVIRDSAWNADRLQKVHERMYDGAGAKAEEYEELRKEKQTLQNKIEGKPTRRMKKKLNAIDKDMEKLSDWFKSLDRRVYLCYVQMAAAVNKDWRDELVERYRFGLEIQKFYLEADHHQDQALLYLHILNHIDNPHPEFVGEVLSVLRKAWRALKNIVKDAREINMPAMKNFEEGERLADFILDGKLVSEPPLEYMKPNWINKMVSQLRGVRRRCFRLHWKSVGGILAMQEKIVAEWLERNGPVDAALVEEPVEAEAIIEAEPVIDAAEILEAAEVSEMVTPPAYAGGSPVSIVVEAPPAYVGGSPPEVAPVVVWEAPAPPPVVVEESEPVFIPPTDDDVFSLDLDAVKPPPIPETPKVEEIISFDLDATKPEPPPVPTPISTIFGETISKPAKNGRPPIKITFVRPGEPSPLSARV